MGNLCGIGPFKAAAGVTCGPVYELLMVDVIPAPLCPAKCCYRGLSGWPATPAENRFLDTVRSACEKFITTPPHGFCASVKALHDAVTRGDVDRRRAAAMASTLFTPKSSNRVAVPYHASAFGLLHACCSGWLCTSSCRCLTLVLSWGTCPHVIKRSGVHYFSSFCEWSEYSEEVQSILLLYGALPWTRTTPMSYCTSAQRRPFQVKHLWQWRRWHTREKRRVWVALLLASSQPT